MMLLTHAKSSKEYTIPLFVYSSCTDKNSCISFSIDSGRCYEFSKLGSKKNILMVAGMVIITKYLV